MTYKDKRDKPTNRDKLKNARKRDLQSYTKRDRYSAKDEIDAELERFYGDLSEEEETR